MALEPGISREDAFEVDGRMLTDVGGHLAVHVLSTPAMVAVMERNASILAQQHLPAGKATVGFEVCVKHVAAALEGRTCTVSAILRQILDGRKLHFDVELREGERIVGFGTHQRRVVDVADHAGTAGVRSAS